MNRGTRAALVALACGALAGIPALARAQQQEPAGSIVARDLPDPAGGHWDANGDQSSSAVTVQVGDTVSFSYPSGASHHNVVFDTAAKPSSCTGLPADQFPAWAPGWSGSCRFDTAGVYHFVCAVHLGMTGTVTVQPVATPTATPVDPYPTPTPTAAPVDPYPAPTATATPLATLKGAVKLASHQKGTHVRGSVKVKTARSRLEVALSVRRSVITGGRSSKQVRLGRWRKTAGKAGRVSFSARLSTTGRAALAKLRKLPLTVTVSLTPPHGHKVTRRLHVTLRSG